MLSTQIEPRIERRTLTPRVAYAHVAAVIGLALFASGTPSPLYGTYRELFGFSPVVLTLIYATDAFGLTNGVASAGGMGLGILISAFLVQLAPAPRVLPYVVLLVLFAIAFAGALLMPEPVEAQGRPRLTPQRPSIPPVVRRPFFL